MAQRELLHRLKTETAELHQEIERSMPVLLPNFSRPDYVVHLKRLFGFYEPLEKALFEADTHLGRPLGLKRSVRTDWLVKDLRQLGIGVSDQMHLPLYPETFEFSELGDLLGTLYVIEGSALGGQIISRKLKLNLGLSDEQLHFYGGYGSETGQRWQKFRRRAEELVSSGEQSQAAIDEEVHATLSKGEAEQSRTNEVQVNRAINAAKKTFSSFMNWLLPATFLVAGLLSLGGCTAGQNLTSGTYEGAEDGKPQNFIIMNLNVTGDGIALGEWKSQTVTKTAQVLSTRSFFGRRRYSLILTDSSCAREVPLNIVANEQGIAGFADLGPKCVDQSFHFTLKKKGK